MTQTDQNQESPPASTPADGKGEHQVRLDKGVFWVSLTVLVTATTLLLINPEASLTHLKKVHLFMTHDLG